MEQLRDTPLFAEVLMADVVQKSDGVYFEGMSVAGDFVARLTLKDVNGVLQPLIAAKRERKRFSRFGVVFKPTDTFIREWSIEGGAEQERLRIGPSAEMALAGTLLRVFPVE